MTRWFRLAVVAMIAVAVSVTIDPLFSLVAGICIISVGVLLDFVLFEDIS